MKTSLLNTLLGVVCVLAVSSGGLPAASYNVPGDFSGLSSAVNSGTVVSGDEIILSQDQDLSAQVNFRDKQLIVRSVDPTYPILIYSATTASGGGVRAIALNAGSTITLDNLIFQGRSAMGGGAGMSIGSGSGLMTTIAGNFTFGNFSATVGSQQNGGFLNYTTANAYVRFGGVLNGEELGVGGKITFANMVAQNQGGVFRITSADFYAADTYFTNNRISYYTTGNSGPGGGVFYITGGRAVTFFGNVHAVGNGVESTLTDRSNNASGGAFRSSGAPLIFKGLAEFENNYLWRGEGGAIYAGQVFFEREAVFKGNKAGWRFDGPEDSRDGGALRISSTLVMAGPSTVTDNQTSGRGGAIYSTGYIHIGTQYTKSEGGQDVTIAGDTVFSGNVSGSYGGAIYQTGATINLQADGGDIIFKDNRAGVSFSVEVEDGIRTPVAGSGSSSAIYFASTSATNANQHRLNLAAGEGHAIYFYDALASTAFVTGTDPLIPPALMHNIAVTKTGSGMVVFDTHESNIYADTAVQEGEFRLTNGAIYGAADSQLPQGTAFVLTATATLSGNGVVRANNVTLEDGATLRADHGALTLAALTQANFGNALHLAGNGSITASAGVLNAADIIVDDGARLDLGSAVALATGGVIGASGTSGNATLGSAQPLELAGDVTLRSEGVDGTLNIAAVLAGASGGIIKDGDGTVVLSAAANTHGGGTRIDRGTLVAKNTAALGTGAVVNNADLAFDFDAASGGVFSPAVSGTGNMTKAGEGALALAGANTYTGATIVRAGALSAGSAEAAAGFGISAGVVLADAVGARFDLGGYDVTLRALDGGGSQGGEVSLGVNALTINTASGAESVFGGVLNGQSGGRLVKEGGGTLAFANTAPTAAGFASDLAVNTGRLNIDGGSFATSGNVSVATGAVLGLVVRDNAPLSTGNFSFGAGASIDITHYGATALGTIDLVQSAAPLPADLSQLQFTFQGQAISPRADQYLNLSLISNDTKLQVAAALVWDGVTDAHGIFNIIADDTFATPKAIADRASGSFTALDGTGWDGKSLTKTGAGTLTLAHVNTYTGATLVNAGTLKFGVADAISTSSAVTVAAGAALDLDGKSQTLHELSGAGDIALGNASVTVANAAAQTFSGIISGDGGRLIKSGNGVLTLGGHNTYDGGTTIESGGGKIVATVADALGTGDVVNNATLTYDVASSGAFLGSISGAGSLAKAGAGELTLAGASLAASTLDVAGGVLHIGSESRATSAAISADATVAGNAGLAVHQGSTLGIGGAFTFADNGTLSVFLGSGTGPIIRSATMSIGAGATLNINGVSGNTLMPFTLISTDRGIAGAFTNLNIGGSGGGSTVDYLTVTALKQGNDYVADAFLTWDNPLVAHGTFTLSAQEESFNIGSVLVDKTPNATTGWDGKSLDKQGLGTLTLSAANTYTGSTVVHAGVLQFGAANAIAQSAQVVVAEGAALDLAGFSQTFREFSGAGSVALGSATLTANNATDRTFSGVITGAGGQLVKTGAGMLTLLGANDYTGGTRIDGGKILVTRADTLGTGDIANNATLEYNLSTVSSTIPVAYTIDSKFSGTGILIKSGADTLVLAGSSPSATGALDIREGIVAITGGYGGLARIESGARLHGTGTIGSILVRAGGFVAPGMDSTPGGSSTPVHIAGALNVAGNVDFEPGSTYQLQLNPDGSNDFLAVSGAANIQSGAKLRVVKSGVVADYSYGTRHTILTAAGGITGTFDDPQADQPLPFLWLLIDQDDNNMYLSIKRNTTPFESIAVTQNQKITAVAAESLGRNTAGSTNDNIVYEAIIALADPVAIRQAYDLLSGEIYATVRTALIADASYARETALNRGRLAAWQRQPGAQRKAGDTVLWAQLLGGFARDSGDGNAATSTRNNMTLFVGGDGRWSEHWRVGSEIGFTTTSLDIDDRNATADTDSYTMGIYGSAAYGPYAVRLGGSGSVYKTALKRDVVFPGYSQSLEGRMSGFLYQLFGELGRQIKWGRLDVEPYVNAAYLYVRQNHMAETGGKGIISISDERQNVFPATLGMRGLFSVALTPQRRVNVKAGWGWQHIFGPTSVTQNVSLGGSGKYAVAGVPLDPDMLVLELGAHMDVSKSVQVGLNYSGRVGSTSQNHELQFSVGWDF